MTEQGHNFYHLRGLNDFDNKWEKLRWTPTKKLTKSMVPSNFLTDKEKLRVLQSFIGFPDVSN